MVGITLRRSVSKNIFTNTLLDAASKKIYYFKFVICSLWQYLLEYVEVLNSKIISRSDKMYLDLFEHVHVAFLAAPFLQFIYHWAHGFLQKCPPGGCLNLSDRTYFICSEQTIQTQQEVSWKKDVIPFFCIHNVSSTGKSWNNQQLYSLHLTTMY